ncbi:MAG: keto-deoxy-phosphogluconate aldolase, partial [Verrucomicrobiales bacterium]
SAAALAGGASVRWLVEALPPLPVPVYLMSYLNHGLIAAVGGSWLAPRDVIRAKDWGTIEANARDAMAAIQS